MSTAVRPHAVGRGPARQLGRRGRRVRRVRHHRRPREGDDAALALPARAARAADLPDRRRRGRRTGATTTCASARARRSSTAARRSTRRSSTASPRACPTSPATSATPPPSSAWPPRSRARAARSSTSRSRRSCSAPWSRGCPSAGLLENARVVVEKPFGHDLESARELAAEMHSYLDESQLYRIDHFLGKMGLAEILYLRFANAMLEPVWNRNYVVVGADHDGRGLRRRGPRALLRPGRRAARRRRQPPDAGRRRDRDGGAGRPRPGDAEGRDGVDLPGDARGRPGALRARPVRRLPRHRRRRGRLDDGDLRRAARSRSTTGAGRACRSSSAPASCCRSPRPSCGSCSSARRGSGFRHAGASTRSRTSSWSSSTRRPACGCCSTRTRADADEPEQIQLDMEFAAEGGEGPAPYEVLLLAAINGDSTRFTRQDGVEEAWRVMQPLLDAPPPVHPYAPGTWGPAAADALVAEARPLARPVGGVMTPPSHDAAAATDRRQAGRPAAERGDAVAVHPDRRLRRSSPTATPAPWSRPTARSTGCACRSSTPRACSGRCSTAGPARSASGRSASTTRWRARYDPGTNVLVTTWRTRSGWIVVRDALTIGPRRTEDTVTPHTRPPADDDAEHLLVRTVECIDGNVEVELVCEPVVRLRARARRVVAGRRRTATPRTRPARA